MSRAELLSGKNLAVIGSVVGIVTFLVFFFGRYETVEAHRADMAAHKRESYLELKLLIREAMDESWEKFEKEHHKHINRGANGR